MNIENVESLLERSRPAPPPAELRRRIVEAAALKRRPVSAFRKPRFVEVMTVAASILMLLGTVTWLLRETPSVPGPAAQEGGQPFVDRRLMEKLPGESITEFVWSADGKHWACVTPAAANTSRPACIVVDGKKEEALSHVHSFRFGADGRYVYLVQDPDRGYVLVVDGISQKEFDSYERPTWSPDGKKLAYVGWKADRSYVVVDGKRSEPYDTVGELLWSPDGTRLAYSAALRNDSFCVLDGKKGEPFDKVRDLTFSPDGKTLAYAANEGAWMMVLGDTKWDEHQSVGRPVFSGNGETIGIVVKDGNRSSLLNGPRPHSKMDSLTAFQELGDPCFSRDGRVWAYRGRMVKKEQAIREQVVIARGSLELGEILVSEEVDPVYESVSDPVVSPDGKQVAYAASKGSRKYLVVGGKPTLKFSLIDRISFGPDGQTLAYRAGQYGKEFVIAGKSRSEEFDEVLSGPVWSADGKRVAFTVRNGSELWSKVLEVK